MDIWLVRHGETEWSRSRRHTSGTDLPLTTEGEEQAHAIGEYTRGHPFVRVLSSPLRRALTTARIAGYGDRIEVTDLLTEYRYGEYEGRTTADIRMERPGWDLWRDGCPGGEHTAQVESRVASVLEQTADSGGDVLIIGHAHSLRVLAACYLGLPGELGRVLHLDAGSLSVLGREREHPAVWLWNFVPATNPGSSPP